MNKANRFFKRMFDISFSFISILVIFPVLFIVSILIKLDSPGPIIYRVYRIGPNKKTFYMYRFRTMRIDVETSEITKMAIKNDARITHLGAFLRSTSLDELPTFFNVLSGDMSIVGPRPQIASIAEYYFEKLNMSTNTDIKSGITGWAQVSHTIDDLGMDDTLDKLARYDNFYIENWSLWFDVKIIALTFCRGFMPRGL